MGRDGGSGMFGALGSVQGARERLNALLRPAAWAVGALGGLALVGCCALHVLPPEEWPSPLRPAHFGLYLMGSLVAASLLGWGAMQEGLGTLRRTVGDTLGGWILVLLPMLCAALTAVHDLGWVDVHALPQGSWVLRFAFLFPPLAAVACLATFLVSHTRPTEEGRLLRLLWYASWILPYALLLGTLVFGLEMGFVDSELRKTIRELGEWGIVIQIGLAYFLSGGVRG